MQTNRERDPSESSPDFLPPCGPHYAAKAPLPVVTADIRPDEGRRFKFRKRLTVIRKAFSEFTLSCGRAGVVNSTSPLPRGGGMKESESGMLVFRCVMIRERHLFGICSPAAVGARTHLQEERSALLQLFVCEPRAVDRPAVERGGLDVFVLCGYIRRFHRKGFTAAEVDCRFFEERASDVVDRASGRYRVEAHGAEYVPRGHLSVVFVAAGSSMAVPRSCRGRECAM